MFLPVSTTLACNVGWNSLAEPHPVLLHLRGTFFFPVEALLLANQTYSLTHTKHITFTFSQPAINVQDGARKKKLEVVESCMALPLCPQAFSTLEKKREAFFSLTKQRAQMDADETCSRMEGRNSIFSSLANPCTLVAFLANLILREENIPDFQT